MSAVVLHADVGPQVGWGHFRECLAVAQELRRRGIDASLLLSGPGREARTEAERLGVPASIAGEPSHEAPHGGIVAHLESRKPPAVLVANLFRLAPEYAAAIRPHVIGFATITELSEEEHGTLNFNISREPRYMPIDAAWQKPRLGPLAQRVREILVCFGGADPKNATGLTLEMLRQGFERGELPRDVEIRVVVGPLFPHAEAIRGIAASYPVRVSLEGPVPAATLVDRVKSADLAVTTGGGTMYEFCSVGTPTLVIPVLDKMAANARVLAQEGAVLALPRCDQITARDLVRAVSSCLPLSRRDELSARSREVIDGNGAGRIADALIQEWKLS